MNHESRPPSIFGSDLLNSFLKTPSSSIGTFISLKQTFLDDMSLPPLPTNSATLIRTSKPVAPNQADQPPKFDTFKKFEIMYNMMSFKKFERCQPKGLDCQWTVCQMSFWSQTIGSCLPHFSWRFHPLPSLIVCAYQFQGHSLCLFAMIMREKMN